METRLVPAAGLELATIDRVPFPRKPSADLLRLPGRLAGAVRQAGRILDEAGADVLVGVGGYVCTPMYLAARRRKIPIVIHEANTRPGLANRVGARLSRHVAVAFAGTPLRNARHVGMPMRREISGHGQGHGPGRRPAQPWACSPKARADRHRRLVRRPEHQPHRGGVPRSAGPRPASRPCTSPAAAKRSRTRTATPLQRRRLPPA